jgi:hypothetical protein
MLKWQSMDKCDKESFAITEVLLRLMKAKAFLQTVRIRDTISATSLGICTNCNRDDSSVVRFRLRLNSVMKER